MLLVLGTVVVRLQVERERRFPAQETVQDVLYVTSPALLQRLVLSYDAVAADIYWIRTIQYYGSTRLSGRGDQGYELLYPLLDLTTSLDPAFSIAYRFGAFFLSEEPPGGAGRPDLAVRLLEKGMAANPTRWEHPYDIGFVHYRLGDYARAADWFRRAADVPGAASWLAPLAAVTLAAGGDVESARFMWHRMLEATDEAWIRGVAEHRLQQLDAIETIRQLEALTAAYERRFGTPPANWEDLVKESMLRGVPLDPAGHAYVLNPLRGTVAVSEASPMWPLPR
jgi:tetratricopeptide (TPR) repeat protein